MNHFTVPSFWTNYNALPKNIQTLADKNFELLKENPKYPSLHLRKIDKYWSVRGWQKEAKNINMFYKIYALYLKILHKKYFYQI